MTELETLQKENKHLKDLLEQVYEMSFLDDMINDACKDRNDDEGLMCNLSLRSQIKEALNLSMTKKTASKIEATLGVKPLRALDKVAKLTRHSNGSMIGKHYDKN